MFTCKGLYVLDEPEAALSPTRQMAMLSRIGQLVKDDSQFIIATHSPILLAYPEANIFQIEGKQLIQKNYEDTEHYQVTKLFINEHKNLIASLLKD